MGFAAFAFYVFAIVAVASSLLVVLAKNPVHSVLWLILAFFASAGLFILLGAEFIAMLMLIVYVGAVAMLFLFVVMMLDVDFTELKGEMVRYMPLGLLVGTILLLLLALIFGTWIFAGNAPGMREAVAPPPGDVENTVALGQLIYTKYVFLFQIAGLILLVAMVGAIVLTFRRRPDIKRQDILTQMYRDPAEAVELKDVKPGQGI